MEDEGSETPSCIIREEEEIARFLEGPVPDQLCRIASNLRNGVLCKKGENIEESGDLSLELKFSDAVIWLARTPLLTHCFLPDENLSSKVSSLQYVKKRTNIPVPEIYHHALASDQGNITGCSFMLMECMPGESLHDIEEAREFPEKTSNTNEAPEYGISEAIHAFDEDTQSSHDRETAEGELVLERLNARREPSQKDIANAKKLHEQLTDLIIELASLTFDELGSLQQDAQGHFHVAPYIENVSIDLSLQTFEMFKSLSAPEGPFSTVSDYYQAQCLSRKARAQVDPRDSEKERGKSLKRLNILETLIPNILSKQHENGPFVLGHDALSSGNILVDEELNITGLVGFTGNIVPLRSLCVYPELFADPYDGPIWDKELFYEVFTTRESANKSSALHSARLRKELLDSSEDFVLMERCVAGHKTWIEAVLPKLYKSVHGMPITDEDAITAGLVPRVGDS